MKTFFIGILAVVVVITAAIFLLPNTRVSEVNDPNIISLRGLHWHPQLEIYVKGEKIDIPQNIGVGPGYEGRPQYGEGSMAMTPIHTHEDVPIIHLEFAGIVHPEDITLGKFFAVWGKDMHSFGKNMKMTVNGEASTQYENYIMRDGDTIVLRYD